MFAKFCLGLLFVVHRGQASCAEGSRQSSLVACAVVHLQGKCSANLLVGSYQVSLRMQMHPPLGHAHVLAPARRPVQQLELPFAVNPALAVSRLSWSRALCSTPAGASSPHLQRILHCQLSCLEQAELDQVGHLAPTMTSPRSSDLPPFLVLGILRRSLPHHHHQPFSQRAVQVFELAESSLLPRQHRRECRGWSSDGGPALPGGFQQQTTGQADAPEASAP